MILYHWANINKNYSPNDKESYIPFNVTVIDKIPNTQTLYWIDESKDKSRDTETPKIFNEYRIHSEVETSDIKINKLIRIN